MCVKGRLLDILYLDLLVNSRHAWTFGICDCIELNWKGCMSLGEWTLSVVYVLCCCVCGYNLCYKYIRYKIERFSQKLFHCFPLSVHCASYYIVTVRFPKLLIKRKVLICIFLCLLRKCYCCIWIHCISKHASCIYWIKIWTTNWIFLGFIGFWNFKTVLLFYILSCMQR